MTNLTQDQLHSQIKCISHEIRNNLSICDMYTQIIRKNLEKNNITNPSIENAIDCIQKSVQIISTNLLDLKSIDSITPKIIDFSQTIERGIALGKAFVIDKDINFEVFIKNSAKIKIDENKFLACIVNIIKNGIEAIDTHGKIEILAEIKDKYGIIKISNTGKPIPKDKQEVIFTQGYTTKKTGCGLGLAICKSTLNSQGAELTLTQSTKSLTRFEIKVPVFEDTTNQSA